MAVRDVVQAAAGVGGAVAGEATYVEDVFSTSLYTGNGTGQIIENGIALGSGYGSGSVKLFNQGTQYSYEILGNNPALNVYSGPFTIECWFYLTADPSGNGAIFAAGIGGNFLPIALNFYNGINTISLSLSEGSNWDALGLTNLTSKVPLNQWHHCSVIYNGSAVGAYLNGTQFAYYATNTLLSSNYINIGAYNAAIDGFISDFRISNIARDSVSSGGSHSQSAWVNSATVADANTVFLSCRKDSPFTDSSSNNISLTVKPTVSASTFGPFDSDVAGEGGMVWIKSRQITYNHELYDTLRGPTWRISSNSTGQSNDNITGLTSFTTNGFSLGASSTVNYIDYPQASWTFRKAPKFFDIVTFTTDGSGGAVFSHNLGSTPGCIIFKSTSASQWPVYHRGLGGSQDIYLNLTNAAGAQSGWCTLTSTEVTVIPSVFNASETYVGYLFAHDAGGFGADGTENVISCGSYTGNGGTQEINLGWEPQWMLVKTATSADNWWIVDNMRGLLVGGNDALLNPNASSAEINNAISIAEPTATGFIPGYPNSSGQTYIYIAIRRPMKTPESGTEVFEPIAYTGTGGSQKLTTSFPSDLVIHKARASSSTGFPVLDRLRSPQSSQQRLYTNTTDEENGSSSYWIKEFGNDYLQWNSLADEQTGNNSGTSYILWNFRRAPGFFDVVGYTGTSTTRQQAHNLGVAPEFVIVKGRNFASHWYTYHTGQTGGVDALHSTMRLNLTEASWDTQTWKNYDFNESTFSLDSDNGVNGSSYTYIAYLFATLPGISKVGSYTGTGADLNVDCGFSAGARFILIKRTDASGDWYVWDSARGIVAGNDPYLLLNSTAAENTSTDYIDPLASGFTVTSSAPAAINASGGSYIFLAIA